MSSHHIIRENQEPALLIQDLSALDAESLGQLLEWSPRVIAHAQALTELQSSGVHIDLVFFEQGHNHLPYLQAGTEVAYFQNDFIREALAYLHETGAKEINILADLSDTSVLESPFPLQISLFASQHKYYAVPSGFSKWQSKGEKVFIPKPLPSLKTFGLDRIAVDTFVTTTDGLYSLHFDHPNHLLIIGEEIPC